MTQVHRRLQPLERMALALEARQKVDFARKDLMTIRRMAADGAQPREIAEEIGFIGCESTFRRLCKKYQIRLYRRNCSNFWSRY